MSRPRNNPNSRGGRDDGQSGARGGRDRAPHRDTRDSNERAQQQRGTSSGNNASRSSSGGSKARGNRGGSANRENELSIAARQRLEALRSEHDPRDDDKPDADRDSYVDVPGGIRLQKALAQAGVASRRASEDMIAAGRVAVDGHTVRRFGARVDPQRSEIRVDGMLAATVPDLLYYALHKPRGVISTMWDPNGRPTLADYTESEERLFHVGRLDTDTEGLILLTNDGELTNRLTHPSYEISKTYLAKVPGPVPNRVVKQIRKGVELEDGGVKVDSFRVLDNLEPTALVEVRLHEGRKHIVRRLLKAVGHPVSELARTEIGPIGLNALKPGTSRVLTAQEVSELYTAAGM